MNNKKVLLLISHLEEVEVVVADGVVCSVLLKTLLGK